MLILGARAVLAAAKNRSIALEQQRGYWKAVVAIAAKNAAHVVGDARAPDFKLPA
jgi:transposase